MIQKYYSPDTNNKIVDSHCHLDFKDFNDDRQKIIERAKSKDVEFLLSISVDLENFDKIHKIASENNNIWCTTGIHPNNVNENPSEFNVDKIYNKINENIKFEKVIGIGETGLDFFRNANNRVNQIESFNLHLEISGKNNYPTIVHTRDAEKDTIFCIKNGVKKFSSKGLIHCFTSTKEFAKFALDQGFYISFSGIITFKNVNDLLEVVKYVPLDRILVETDSPYLAPAPFRGKRNEPSYVRYTVEKISEIKKMTIPEITRITTNNFFNLFSNIKNEKN